MNNITASSKNLGLVLDNAIHISNTLQKDIERILDLFDENWTDQALRRLFIRTYWSMIEGDVFCIKQLTLTACNLGEKPIDKRDHSFLLESKIIVNSQGVAEVKAVYEATLTNIQRTFKLANKYFEIDWQPNFNDISWQKVRSCIISRHEITHPKKWQDLSILIAHQISALQAQPMI